MREVLFGASLLVAAGLIVAGVAGWSGELSLIVGGVLLAGWSWLVLSAAGSPDVPPAEVEDS